MSSSDFRQAVATASYPQPPSTYDAQAPRNFIKGVSHPFGRPVVVIIFVTHERLMAAWEGAEYAYT